MHTIFHTPLPFCLGDGSEENPYRSPDGCAGIAEAMTAAGERGCNVYLPSARYNHSSPIVLRTPSTGLHGEIWACNTDPNGVFEPKNGTKLRRIGTGYPSIIGHEFVGKLVECNADEAAKFGLAVGDNVIADIAVPCGECLLFV